MMALRTCRRAFLHRPRRVQRQCLVVVVAAAFLCPVGFVNAADSTYHLPRRADGRVDMQGVWVHRNLTPLERPRDIATHFIPAEEAARMEASIADFFEGGGEPTEFYDVRGIEPINGRLRSSLITDPDDGRVPWNDSYRDARRKVLAALFSAYEGPEARPLEERCLFGPGGPPIAPYPVNNLHQIVQTDSAVVIASESLHDARIVRLGAKHGPAAVVSWLGDSVGRWEGDTLVIETTYFTPASRNRFFPQVLYFVSPTTTVVERLSRVSANELRYVFTVSDPAFYTSAWSGETRLHRTSDRPFEAACHEGNYALRFILEGARAQEAHGVEDQGPKQLR
jgi:hypothetical protein